VVASAILAAAVAALESVRVPEAGRRCTRASAVPPSGPGGAPSAWNARHGAHRAGKARRSWFHFDPLAARASPVQVQRLLAIAGAKSAGAAGATDLARFDLERPVRSDDGASSASISES
jgi:hypothetical protein